MPPPTLFESPLSARRSVDGGIVCRNSQMGEVHGTLLRLDRYSVVFEVYSPYSIVQLSEVLSDFRIYIGERLLFHGRATVASLVNTGVVLVCEVNLDDAWIDVDFFKTRQMERTLGAEFRSFIGDWRKLHQVADPFKVVVADMVTMFTGVQRWLDQVELGMRSITSASREELEREVFDQLGSSVIEETGDILVDFEQVAAEIEESQQPVHKSYVRRELHPIVLCAPFVYRSFAKPLGYAGDYQMVNMMLEQPREGSSLFAKVINQMFLETPPVIAHRNRIDYLFDVLEAEGARAAEEGRTLRVLNLGCGPAGELRRFIRKSPLAENASFTLLDFNEETLEFAGRTLEATRERRGIPCELDLRLRSVHRILKESTRSGNEFPPDSYDLVYCAGLFDYLSDRVCARLLEIFLAAVRPGGLVVATNVSTSNPSRRWMEFVVEWNLIYRSVESFPRLVPDMTVPPEVQVREDPTGVNLFLEMRRPR